MALDVRQNVLDDAALYNYGEDWRRIFEVVPERLLGVVCKDSPHDMLSKSDEHIAPEDYKAHIREAQKALDIWEWADNRDVGLARIHLYVIDSYLFVADKIALDTGRALVIFFDTYGRTVRRSRLPPRDGEHLAGAWWDGCIDEDDWFLDAEIGPDYLPGGLCGPPYTM